MGGFDAVFGDLAFDREMRENQIKGNLLGRRAWYIRDRWGDAAVAAVAAAVPESARKYLVDAPPLTFAWYPFGVMMDIDHAIVDGPMGGEIGRMREFGSAIAKHDLPMLYKVLFKVGSPSFIIKRLNIVAKQYIRESTITSVVADGRATVTQGGRRFPMYFCTYGVSGWFHAALELSGAKSSSVEHASCLHRGAAACTWELRWA